MQKISITLQNSNNIQMNNGVHFSQFPNLSNMQIPNNPCNLQSNGNCQLGNPAYMANNVPFNNTTMQNSNNVQMNNGVQSKTKRWNVWRKRKKEKTRHKPFSVFHINCLQKILVA